MQALLADMAAAGHPCKPVLVASNDPLAGGLAKAAAHGVPVAAVDHRIYGADRRAFEAALIDPLRRAKADLICLAGFMRILTPMFIAEFRGKMLNIHPSLLPKYPGLHTHARALAAGDAEAGCSVHEVIPELDAGPLRGQARVPILNGDTEKTLADRVLAQEHRLYPMCLRAFARGEKKTIFLP